MFVIHMSFVNFLKGLDIFGHPVSVNYRGESSFNTGIGGFFTLICHSVVLVYTVTKVTQNPVGRRGSDVFHTTIFKRRPHKKPFGQLFFKQNPVISPHR